MYEENSCSCKILAQHKMTQVLVEMSTLFEGISHQSQDPRSPIADMKKKKLNNMQAMHTLTDTEVLLILLLSIISCSLIGK